MTKLSRQILFILFAANSLISCGPPDVKLPDNFYEQYVCDWRKLTGSYSSCCPQGVNQMIMGFDTYTCVRNGYVVCNDNSVSSCIGY